MRPLCSMLVTPLDTAYATGYFVQASASLRFTRYDGGAALVWLAEVESTEVHQRCQLLVTDFIVQMFAHIQGHLLDLPIRQTASRHLDRNQKIALDDIFRVSFGKPSAGDSPTRTSTQ